MITRRPTHPSALPDYRADVDSALIAEWDYLAAAHGLRETEQDLLLGLRRAALHGQQWWIDRDAGLLVDAAAATIPADGVTLDRDRYSGTGGVMFFESPLMVDLPQHTGDPVSVDAVLWCTAASDETGETEDGGVVIRLVRDVPFGCAIYLLHFEPDAGYLCVGGSALLFDTATPPRWASGALGGVTRWVAALFRLAAQPELIEQSESVPDRATRRRAERAGHPSKVTIVRLRQRRINRPDPDDTGRHLTHRHVVEGHWKWQPYGPGRTERRYIYVAPYVRGPDGAELVLRPRVHVL